MKNSIFVDRKTFRASVPTQDCKPWPGNTKLTIPFGPPTRSWGDGSWTNLDRNHDLDHGPMVWFGSFCFKMIWPVGWFETQNHQFSGAVVLLRTVNPSQKQCNMFRWLDWTFARDLSEVYCPQNRLFTSCLFGSCPLPRWSPNTTPMAQWPCFLLLTPCLLAVGLIHILFGYITMPFDILAWKETIGVQIHNCFRPSCSSLRCILLLVQSSIPFPVITYYIYIYYI